MVESTNNFLEVSKRSEALNSSIDEKFKTVSDLNFKWGYNGDTENYKFAPKVGEGKEFVSKLITEWLKTNEPTDTFKILDVGCADGGIFAEIKS
jgi:hypothetical protein